MKRTLLFWLHNPKLSRPKQLALVGITALLLTAFIYWMFVAYQARTLRQQVTQVLPGASQFQQLQYFDRSWQPVDLGSDNEDSLYAGYDQTGQFVGYAVPGEGPGYQNPIRLLYGYRPEQRLIVGMKVLDSGETTGWGEQALQDEDFLANFRALAVDPKLEVVESGEKDQPNEVDIMTGATISSQAIVQILNATNRRWLRRLPASGSEPPLVNP
ncbi:MAG: FMN-binding protein [Candidatus Competibacteraceae bacterium]|nr:FMN-binding protein [Candidatus Competibacteraceae bacterium]